MVLAVSIPRIDKEPGASLFAMPLRQGQASAPLDCMSRQRPVPGHILELIGHASFGVSTFTRTHYWIAMAKRLGLRAGCA
jgi:hypothetical protein